MTVSTDLVGYYARRAAEYERVYAKPERQPDLAVLKHRVAAGLANRRVYEVACGTGYWTQFYAERATSVFACDYNEAVLEIARTKPLPSDRVQWVRADAFALPPAPLPCDGGFAGFWWSHLRREGQAASFLQGFCRRLEPGARVLVIDNAYVEGSSTPITRVDADGNTYQERRLSDGSRHEVLKNFPDEAEIRALLTPVAVDIQWERLPYYWWVTAEVR